MDVVSFFSYKGGVGRSLAVSHVAEQLSRHGLSSLVIDFDLEAPGMQYKFEKDLDKIKKEQGIKKGLVDYIHTFFAENEKKKLPEHFEDYYYTLPIEDKRKAQIWLMPAGNLHGDYWNKLAEIDWKHDFLSDGDRLGSHLLIDLKERIKKTLKPDYILIDSRTGISDITTLTLRLMADKVVVIAVNNRENLDGSETILQAMLAKHNWWNDEPKELFFALSRFPKPGSDDEVAREKNITEDIRSRFVPTLVKKGNFTILHDDHELAWGEKDISRSLDTEHRTLKEDYGNLFNIITRDNPKVKESDRKKISAKEETDLIISKADALYDQGKYEEALKTINQTRDYYRGPLFYNLRSLIYEMLYKYELSIKDSEKSVALGANDAVTYYNWGTYLGKLANSKGDDRTLYEQAIEKLQKALEINPMYTKAYLNWGGYLTHIAFANKVNEKVYREAFLKFQEVIKIDPNSAMAYSNWGVGLGHLAKAKNYNRKLYEEAFAKYKKATELKPDYYIAYLNWGLDLAKFAASIKEQRFYTSAIEKFKKASEISPNEANSYINWGWVLCQLAELKTNDKKLYQQAFAKFEKAAEIDSSDYYVFSRWGNYLLKLAASGQRVNLRVLNEAIEKLLRAEKLKPDVASYDLACAFSLQQDFKKALFYLERRLKAKSILLEQIDADADLNNIRNLPEFKLLVAKYFTTNNKQKKKSTSNA